MLINKIKMLQNRCIRIICSASLNIPIHCDEIRKTMRILNIEDQLKFQISSLLWDYDNNNLPEHLSKYFERTNLVHNYETRGAGKGNLFYSKVNTLSYGIKSFKFQGVKTLNEPQDKEFYENSKCKAIESSNVRFECLRLIKIL